MTIQCPACLENNPIGTNNCQICGYSLVEFYSDNDKKNDKNTKNTGNFAPHHLKPNTFLLNERYQVEETLGEGGFGITYKGVYLANNVTVAIKELWYSVTNSIYSLQLKKQFNDLQIKL